MRPRLAALLALVALAGCLRWQRVSIESVRDGRVDLRTRTVRISAPGEQAELVVHRVDGARVEGWDAARNLERRIDLARAREVRVRETDPLGSALLVGAVYLAVSVVSWLAVVVDAF